MRQTFTEQTYSQTFTSTILLNFPNLTFYYQTLRSSPQGPSADHPPERRLHPPTPGLRAKTPLHVETLRKLRPPLQLRRQPAPAGVRQVRHRQLPRRPRQHRVEPRGLRQGDQGHQTEAGSETQSAVQLRNAGAPTRELRNLVGPVLRRALPKYRNQRISKRREGEQTAQCERERTPQSRRARESDTHGRERALLRCGRQGSDGNSPATGLARGHREPQFNSGQQQRQPTFVDSVSASKTVLETQRRGREDRSKFRTHYGLLLSQDQSGHHAASQLSSPRSSLSLCRTGPRLSSSR